MKRLSVIIGSIVALALVAVVLAGGRGETPQKRIEGELVVTKDGSTDTPQRFIVTYQDDATYRVEVYSEDGSLSQEMTVVGGWVYMVGRDPGGNPVTAFKEERPAVVDGRPVQVTFAVLPESATTDGRWTVVETAHSDGLVTAWRTESEGGWVTTEVSYTSVESIEGARIEAPAAPAGVSEWQILAPEARGASS